LKNKDLISSNVLSRSSKLISFISLHKHHKRHVDTVVYTAAFCGLPIVPPTSIQIDYTSMHNPRQSKTTEKGNPNSIIHVPMKKKMVHGFLIPLIHATSVHHNDVPLYEVTHGKNLS
jgi:hypothetical protein